IQRLAPALDREPRSTDTVEVESENRHGGRAHMLGFATADVQPAARLDLAQRARSAWPTS
ncbi:MAG: hypothetical protein QOG01_3342, partial [Pseudonocardiales bacterium]|nr:hypothetical protein [Pseudonocardiales bacterium]